MKKIRVGCSVRVSHEEQLKGLSIDTQITLLRDYIEKHKEYVLVDFYVDKGVSADKLKKRKEMQRLLQDVQDGKIDMILFTRLDRWFRSVQKYYEVQAILDKHNVTWKAILEDYETQTANGRLKVNIMLSVAQSDRERTGEKIKDVFSVKVKNGEALYGDGAVPFGFAVVNKKMVHNEDEEEILKVLLNHYYTFQSVRKTVMFAKSEYGITLSYPRFRRLLSNPFLYGCYRDNLNYCEPYITKQRFDEIQAILKKNIRVRNSKHNYIFSGLIRCPKCGCLLIGGITQSKRSDGTKRVHLSYRCESHFLKKNDCTFNKSKSQPLLEQELLKKLTPMLQEYVASFDAKSKPKKKPIDKEKIKAELDRLNNMYLKGRISEEFYDAKYTELNKKLVSVDIDRHEQQAKNEIIELSSVNLVELYNTFTDEEKRTFLRGIIKEIRIDDCYNITEIIFL